ncbi:hypothetical protein C7M52_02780 [Mixta theicola]|nr:hypothetical protein [Mixta theicola]QHM76797.1 hypothetical protein C7M52_02780 [Mixta theicola]
MFFSLLSRLLLITVLAGCGYAIAAELPDIYRAPLTPPAEEFTVLSPVNHSLHEEADGALADSVAAPPSANHVALPSSQQPEDEDSRQNEIIAAILKAIRQRQLTPLPSECLSMSIVADNDDPAWYLIDVRENRNHPACGGDPETAPHLFFFRAHKADDALQTDAGVEPEDFYPLEEKPAVAALTMEDFAVQVAGVTLTLGQPWNEDVMMSLPPERARQALASGQNGAPAYRYVQHRYDALTLTAANENWDRLQRSADDRYIMQIALLDGSLTTQRGIHIGAPAAEMLRSYGPGEASERGGESWLSWRLAEKTLSVRLSDGVVSQIVLSQLQQRPQAQP